MNLYFFIFILDYNNRFHLKLIYLHCEYGFNIHSIRNNINLYNRNKNISMKNFERIFGYEYYEKNFEPKIFIEEVSNLIKKLIYSQVKNK